MKKVTVHALATPVTPSPANILTADTLPLGPACSGTSSAWQSWLEATSQTSSTYLSADVLLWSVERTLTVLV